MAKRADLSDLKRYWTQPFVTRKDIARFSSGLMSPQYLANLDIMDKGPAGRFKVGNKIAYPVSSVIEWLESRSEVIE